MTSAPEAIAGKDSCRILGIDFFCGSCSEAVKRMQAGGLLVVPAAPALKDLGTNAGYREALLHADLVIPDSAFMVLIWNWIARNHVRRLSGLEYLRELLEVPAVRHPGNTLWIMASAASARQNVLWLEQQGIVVPPSSVYLAPLYGAEIEDAELIGQIESTRPKHVLVTVGGGTQERLGLYLKRNLSYCPAIYCIGAAIAFLSGDQVRIPVWADRLYLGWLFRSLSEPVRYVPRYWEARKLLRLMLRYRDQLPPFVGARERA